MKFYVQEMEKQNHMSPDFQSGFKAYDNWIQALKQNTYNAFGLRYSTTVYAEAKMMAAQYVRKLANAWGGIQGLHDVADRFDRIADIYRRMMLEVLEQDWDGAKHLRKQIATEQARGMIPYLHQAKSLETESVRIIKEACLPR